VGIYIILRTNKNCGDKTVSVVTFDATVILMLDNAGVLWVGKVRRAGKIRPTLASCSTHSVVFVHLVATFVTFEPYTVTKTCYNWRKIQFYKNTCVLWDFKTLWPCSIKEMWTRGPKKVWMRPADQKKVAHPCSKVLSILR